MNDAQISSGWVTYDEAHQREAYYVAPAAATARRGTILMLQEIFGVNDAMRHIAATFAAQGYRVILPDVFARSERRVSLGYDPESRKKGFALMHQLDMKLAIDDCRGAVDWALSQPDSNGKFAVIGFCLGGQLAVRFAAVRPCDGVVSFYGVRLEECADELRAIRCPFQFHVGTEDTHIPATSVKAVAGVLDEMPNAALYVYPNAGHGFFNLLRLDVFQPEAFDVANGRVRALLAEVLA